MRSNDDKFLQLYLQGYKDGFAEGWEHGYRRDDEITSETACINKALAKIAKEPDDEKDNSTL